MNQPRSSRTTLAAEMASQLGAGGIPLREQPVVLPPDKRPCYKTFTPIANWVAVRVHHVSETQGGLTLPDGVSDPSQTPICTVVAVGPECKHVREGQLLVVPGSQQGVRFTHGGACTVVMFKEDMLCCGMVLSAEEIAKNRAAALGEKLA